MSKTLPNQLSLFEEKTPAEQWEEETVKRALDELFNNARRYRSSESYWELLQFVSRFRFYAPYNGMLLQIQMSGATYVAPAHRWISLYGRFIKPNARPLVILQPMGPVMFVFDVTDTEPGEKAQPLPTEVEKPFEVLVGQVGGEYERTVENAKRDGVRIQLRKEGSQSAGSIMTHALPGIPPLLFQTGTDSKGKPIYNEISVRYDLLINENLSREAQYATMVHELAHLYCGHIGTPNKKWWPNRLGLGKNVLEIEAESVAFMVCGRLNINNPSADYLSGYFRDNPDVPSISTECIMKTAGLIEQMGKDRLKPRKD